MKLSYEEHQKFGELVKDFREEVLQKLCVGTKSSKEHRAISRVLNAIDHMKHEMDNTVCRDYPYEPNAHKLYYGMSEAWIKRQSVLNQTKP